MNRIELRPQKRPQTRPSISPRPPTSEGIPPTLDIQGWLTTTGNGATLNAAIETGVAGDMIIMIGYEGSGGSFAAAPTGFTEVFYQTDGTHGMAMWVKIADGTEGSTVEIDNQSANTVINTNRIKANGATLSTAGILSNTGLSNNPPAVTLASSEYVLLAPFHVNRFAISAPPTGYEYGVDQTDGDFGSDFAGVVSQKLVTGPGTEDPSAYSGTPDIAPEYIVATVAIPIDPAGATVAPADHSHVEADVTDLDHWTETDHDALDHTGLTGVGGGGNYYEVTGRTTSAVQTELNAVSDGTTLFFPAATYNFSASALSVSGRSGLTFLGEGYGTVLDGADTAPIISVANSTDITFKAMRFLGDNTSGTIVKTGIKAQTAVFDLTVDGCWFEDLGYDGVHVLNGTLSRRFRVVNSSFYRCLDDAVNPGGGGTGDSVDGWVVANNVIRSCGEGIHCSIGSQYGTIVGNYIEDSTTDGIGLNKASHITITGNVLVNNTIGVTTYSNTPHEDIVIAANVFVGGTRAVDIVHTTNRLSIVDNHMRGQSSSTVRLANVTDGTVRDNELSDQTIEESTGCSRLVFEGNRVASQPTTSSAISRRNIVGGLPTENDGTSTIADTDSTVNVTHGMSGEPAVVNVTPRANEAIWVSARNTTTFTVSRSGTSGDLDFDWSARNPGIGVAPSLPYTTGLAFHFDANAISGKADGDAISQWDDDSGNSRHATQATGTKQPVYKVGIIGGRPVVRFDGSNDILQTAAITDIEQANTGFVVAKIRSLPGAGNAKPWFDGNDGTDRHYIGLSGNEIFFFAGTSVLSGDNVDTNPHYYTGLFNGASSTLRQDGVEIAASDAGSQGLGGISIGGRWDESSGTFSGSDIAEILIFDHSLGTSDRDDVEDYLSEKWSI